MSLKQVTVKTDEEESKEPLSDQSNRVIVFPPAPPQPSEANQNQFCSNYISTTKYNVLSFVPLNLIEQFQKKANFYFLIIAILSLTSISPKPAFVSIAPLVFVLMVSAIKEGYEDYRRYIQDVAVNSTGVQRWNSEREEFEVTTWKELKVGDLVRLKENEECPADILLLKTSADQGMCHVQTANLDGETNVKLKRAAACTFELECGHDGLDYPLHFSATVESSGPSPKMDQGSWTANISGIESTPGKFSLGMTQLVLRGCLLKNTSWIVGLVIFTGIETKIMLNGQGSSFKRSKVERTVDKALYSIFAFQFLLCLWGSVVYFFWLKGSGVDHWYLELGKEDFPRLAASNFLTFLVLLDLLG